MTALQAGLKVDGEGRTPLRTGLEPCGEGGTLLEARQGDSNEGGTPPVGEARGLWRTGLMLTESGAMGTTGDLESTWEPTQTHKRTHI